MTTPTANQHFRVEFAGLVLDYMEVVLPEARTDIVEIREANSISPHKIPGTVHYSSLILRRRISQDSTHLFGWWHQVAAGQPNNRHDITITLSDPHTLLSRKWTAYGAWPCRYSVSPLIASDSNSAPIETLECAVERFDLTP